MTMKNRSRRSHSLAAGSHAGPNTADVDRTDEFARRLEGGFAEHYFRRTQFGATVSSIGIGTYLGECTDAEDAAYTDAVCRAIAGGINLIDTAINYRCQRSERAVGEAIRRALAEGEAERASLVVCTKGGYVPLDRVAPATRDEYSTYVQREFIDSAIIAPEDLVAGGHCLAPRFLRYCIAKSRQNLGLRRIDLYHLHNPEQQLGSISLETLRARLRVAFGALEEAVARGDIGAYGCATWNGFRVAPDATGHLSLADLVRLAREAGGDGHHFRAVQLPINLAMLEAVRTPTQPLGGRMMTVLEAATDLGVTVIASASLMQARLAAGLPDAARELFPTCDTDAQRAIEFVRTLDGVAAALVGMRSPRHVDENLNCARRRGGQEPT